MADNSLLAGSNQKPWYRMPLRSQNSRTCQSNMELSRALLRRHLFCTNAGITSAERVRSFSCTASKLLIPMLSEENQKMRYKFKKITKNGPTWANLEPQEKKPSLPDGMANPHSLLRKERNPSVTFRKPIQVIKLNKLKPLVHFFISHAYVVPEPPRICAAVAAAAGAL